MAEEAKQGSGEAPKPEGQKTAEAAPKPEGKKTAEAAPKPEGKKTAEVALKPEDKKTAEAAPKPEGQEAEGAARGRVKASRSVPYGIAHVKATFNNTMVTITDARGGTVAWCSAGRAGFKGSRKSTAFAATLVAQDAARQALSRGMREIEVRVQGPGSGRESAVRALQAAGLGITVIKDVTTIPHNGCRPPKRRRV